MRYADILPFQGKVALLDLVSGMQVCTEITKVNTESVETGKIMVFQIAVEPQDPSMPPGPANPVVQKVNAMPYGGPFTLPKSDGHFDLAHIITVHEPVGQIEKGYLQAVSGIEIAGADALSGLARP